MDAFSPVSEQGDSVPKQDQTERESTKPVDHPPETDAVILRIDRLEERLTHLESSIEAQIAALEHASSRSSARTSEHFVTRAELGATLSATMDQFAGTLDGDIQRRFDVQNRSVQSLRTMVARTDELLEQVLETIESAGIPA